MKRAAILVCLCAGFVSSGCDDYVERSKYDALTKEAAQGKVELEQAKAALEACRKKPEHHYELRNEGFRTFRFDSATGDTCISLTSTADWKRPETIREGCQYQDYLRDNPGPTAYWTAECDFVGKCPPPPQ
jgi:hypothetical protein